MLEADLLRETNFQFAISGALLLVLDVYLSLRLYWTESWPASQGGAVTLTVFERQMMIHIQFLLLVHTNLWCWIHLATFAPLQRRRFVFHTYTWVLIGIAVFMLVIQIAEFSHSQQYWWHHALLFLLWMGVFCVSAVTVSLWKFVIFCSCCWAKQKRQKVPPETVHSDVEQAMTALAAIDAQIGNQARASAVIDALATTTTIQRQQVQSSGRVYDLAVAVCEPRDFEY